VRARAAVAAGSWLGWQLAPIQARYLLLVCLVAASAITKTHVANGRILPRVTQSECSIPWLAKCIEIIDASESVDCPSALSYIVNFLRAERSCISDTLCTNRISRKITARINFRSDHFRQTYILKPNLQHIHIKGIGIFICWRLTSVSDSCPNEWSRSSNSAYRKLLFDHPFIVLRTIFKSNAIQKNVGAELPLRSFATVAQRSQSHDKKSYGGAHQSERADRQDERMEGDGISRRLLPKGFVALVFWTGAVVLLLSFGVFYFVGRRIK
jgi:hypothetical protein